MALYECRHCRHKTGPTTSAVCSNCGKAYQVAATGNEPKQYAVSLKPAEPAEKPVLLACKWIAIGWSAFCVFGGVSGMVAAGSEMSKPGYLDSYSQAGGTLGVAAGLFLWLMAWGAIAGPAALIYFMSNRKP